MKKNKKRFPKFSPTQQLFLAIALFVVAVQATGDGEVAGWEISLFNFVYGLPDFMRPFFLFITQFGSIYVLGILLLVYAFKKRYHIVLRLLMTGLLAYLASGFAKDIWGRVRPNEILLDVVNLDYIVRGPGFPSGHTALAVALALTVAHYLPRRYSLAVATVWIAGVGISRMYLGIHFPLDIVGGFAIGWMSYALFRHIRMYDITAPHKRRLEDKPARLAKRTAPAKAAARK